MTPTSGPAGDAPGGVLNLVAPWWWSPWCRAVHAKRGQLLGEVARARAALDEEIERRETLAHDAADALHAVNAALPLKLPEVFREARRMESLIQRRVAERGEEDRARHRGPPRTGEEPETGETGGEDPPS